MANGDVMAAVRGARHRLVISLLLWEACPWSDMMKTRLRIAKGEQWLVDHPDKQDQERGRELLKGLRFELVSQEAEETMAGTSQHRLRQAFDDTERLFLEAEAEYLDLVMQAKGEGLYGEGEEWTDGDQAKAEAEGRQLADSTRGEKW